MGIIVYSNENRVIQSGSVLFDSQADVKFEIEEDVFNFELVIKTQKTEDGKQIIERNVEENVVTLVCKNFNELGTGTTLPLRLVANENKELLMHLWLRDMCAQVKEIEYSFYLREVKANG